MKKEKLFTFVCMTGGCQGKMSGLTDNAMTHGIRCQYCGKTYIPRTGEVLKSGGCEDEPKEKKTLQAPWRFVGDEEESRTIEKSPKIFW